MNNHQPLTLMNGAEPYFHRGGAAGVLCLHGFTASPAETRWLGESLAGRGMTVYVPRLAGHGTEYHDLARLRWQDWYYTALDGYHILAQQCDRVFVVGHSMGGTLALLLAAHVPVAGIGVLAAPIIFHHWTLAYAHLFRFIRPYTDQTGDQTLTGVIRHEQTRRGEPVVGRVRYNIWSTAAVAQLTKLINTARAALPQVTAPLLLVYSQADTVIPLENADVIAAGVRSTIIERQIVAHSDHILIQDHERESVFGLVGDFLAAQSG